MISAFRPRQTVPLILVRHASAGRKADWPGDDESRPLDEQGAADARALARLLACFAPTARVISSPALRCTETVRPFAAGLGGPSRPRPVWPRLAALPVFPPERTWLTRSGACFPIWWRIAVRPSCACTGRTSPMRSPRCARRSARRPRCPRIRRCPRAVSGSCTRPRGNWPGWSVTTCPARDDPGVLSCGVLARRRVPAASVAPSAGSPGGFRCSSAAFRGFVLVRRGLRGPFSTSGLICFVGSGGRGGRPAPAAPPETPGDIADE